MKQLIVIISLIALVFIAFIVMPPSNSNRSSAPAVEEVDYHTEQAFDLMRRLIRDEQGYAGDLTEPQLTKDKFKDKFPVYCITLKDVDKDKKIDFYFTIYETDLVRTRIVCSVLSSGIVYYDQPVY